jgi:class 3 adenylate cyclase/tetratricopeptide (TPR) repeat protein
MSSTLDHQIKELKHAIAELEAQRSILGDEAVDAALVPSRKKLAALEAQAGTAEQKSPQIPTRLRKLVTLLYMDVVGSTAMTQHLDPEDTLEIMDNALPRLASPIEAHGGHVTRYTGDGFKAVFGDPVAREDDPEQAVRTGLEILEVSKTLSQEIEKEWGIEDFQIRIGIDTGLAALGGRTEAEDTVMGRVVNLAVRIESAAPPGGLLISHNTYRHVRGVFNVEPQELISAKGFPEPVPVYLVREIKPRAFRVQTRGVEGVETHMVGRRTELDTLKDALFTTFEEGEGQVITISGEAGVGKSRLLYEFQNWIELLPPSQSVRFFQGRGKQEAQGLPYSLLRDVFTFRFQILDDDTGAQARRKIETGFGEIFGTESDGVMRTHILGQLLGFDFSASPHLKGVINDAEQLRNRGVMYLIQYFQDLSQEMPVVIFLEDIHWGDESSLNAVSRIGEFTPQYPLLIICAARPLLFERRPYWGEGQTFHTCLELRPLSKRESRKLVVEILKLAENIPSELRELVVHGAEGNPFYTEELIKMLIEDGVIIPDEETWGIDLTHFEEVDVPSTLVGVLQARLDGLPVHERTVLQQASVVGRLFWDRIVSHIQSEGGDGGDPQHIPQVLTSLRDRELIFRHEESAFVGAVEYLFKHDVLREVTYESVLKRLRKTYHGLVADWLIGNSGDRIGEYSGLIAEHLLQSGRNKQACNYFNQAGESALASFANSEAVDYFRLALELFPSEPLRADILSGLGKALRLQGLNEEAEEVFRLAIELYRQSGNSDRLGDVYSNLSWLLWYIDDYHKAWELCQEALKLLEGMPDSLGYARLLAEAGRTALFADVTNQVIPLCQRAVDMAIRVGNLEVQTQARITMAISLDDAIKSIDILEEVLDLAEGNDLFRSAIRSHNNISSILEGDILDLNSAQRHAWRAAEIAKQIGHNEAIIFSLRNVCGQSVGLGKLDSIEDELNEFLQSSTVPKTRVDEFFQSYLPYLIEARGDWSSALEFHREILKYFQDQGNIQRIIERRTNIADNILEQNRFGHCDDLSEVEIGLLENIDQSPIELYSRYYLVIVYIRQGKLQDARDQLVRANKLLSELKSNIYSPQYLQSKIDIEMAITEHHWEEAIDACESTVDAYRRGGFRWDTARNLVDLGDALVGCNELGDLDRARETYQQSLDMFTEMGAPGYIKVLEERLANL